MLIARLLPRESQEGWRDVAADASENKTAIKHIKTDLAKAVMVSRMDVSARPGAFNDGAWKEIKPDRAAYRQVAHLERAIKWAIDQQQTKGAAHGPA